MCICVWCADVIDCCCQMICGKEDNGDKDNQDAYEDDNDMMKILIVAGLFVAIGIGVYVYVQCKKDKNQAISIAMEQYSDDNDVERNGNTTAIQLQTDL